MKMKHWYSIILVHGSLIACGHQKSQFSPTTSPAPKAQPQADSLALSGYIANAFEVTVDGVRYRDLEDYYTQELEKLPAKVRESGISDATDIELDARIGFSDLWNDMTVYVLADAQHGYQGNSHLDGDGSFSIDLPLAAAKQNYKIRANKRIRVLITASSESYTYCFNFSAVDQSVYLDEDVAPVILDKFVSSLTKYDCTQENKSGELSIPVIESKSSANQRGLKPGQTPDVVLGLLGTKNLQLVANKWCYSVEAGQTESVCAFMNVSACACSVTFDKDKKLISQSNIDLKYLDIFAW